MTRPEPLHAIIHRRNAGRSDSMKAQGIALVVLGFAAAVVLAFLLLQLAPPLKVSLSGDSNVGPGPRPGTPTPVPPLPCGEQDAKSLDLQCRRLAAKQPLYWDSSPQFSHPSKPEFTAQDFASVDAYALRGNQVRLPFCRAWNPNREESDGYDPRRAPVRPSVSPGPTPTLVPYPSPPRKHYYYYAYATPEDFALLRSVILHGFNQGGVFVMEPYTIQIGASGKYRVWVSSSPLVCTSTVGAVIGSVAGQQVEVRP